MEWWHRAWELHQAPDSDTVCDAKSFHSIATLLSRNHGRPDVAQEWLSQVCDHRYRRQHDTADSSGVQRTEPPRVATLGVIVASWLGHVLNAPEKAQALVSQWENYHRSGVVPVGPDALAYKSLVIGLTHCPRLPEAREQAYELLQTMRKLVASGDFAPLERTIYTQVIYAFARGRVDAVRAEEVLRQLYDDHQHGRLAGDNDDDSNNNKMLPLELKCFNNTLTAWSRVGRVDRVEALICDMQSLHKRKVLSHPCDTATYNILLHSWAQTLQRSYAERAEQLVQQMMTGHSTTNAASRTAQLPRPNAITLGSLLQAWVGVGDADRALRVLQVMCHEFSQKGRLEMQPQRRHFEQMERLLDLQRQQQPNHPDNEQRFALFKEMEQQFLPA